VVPWRSTGGDANLYVRTDSVSGQRIVLAPFIHTAWVHRDAGYRRRRRIVTAAIVAATAAATALSVLFVIGLARPRTVLATVFAIAYGLLALVGLWAGRRWLRRAPARARWTRDGGGLVLGAALFLLMPFVAGFGLAIVPALFHHDFPGEQRARELTEQLTGSDLKY
jgi:membrane protease YdiL (CAAX protease family)